ncbi:intermembrane lipid transfer protein VPS13D isoform X1 [Dermacentor andersoni]|uniref:intermembrane lipid transfer protein VPS13D isoform X1 n=1 Tax=Dermacentor andersoni TaxID=34620 RepID=UPI003B3BDAF4
MLEGLAAWVLNTYVGGYVENLNTHQLSIGLLRGQVELENLPLKKDAFRHLLLPLEIKAGFIGKLSLKIPVTRLRSEPWLITIEQLYIVIGPVSLDDYDEVREDQVLQNAKIAKLDAMEAKWKASYESKQEPSYYAYSYAAWLTCGTSVMTNIIKNLQFKIKDIHIRCEDGCTDPQNPFACGITIQTLSSQAAAADEAAAQESASGAADDVAHQSVQLSGFAVYWDSDVTLLGSLDIPAVAEAMKKHQTHALSTARTVRPHSYLLATTSFQAQISRNCSPQPLRVRSKPRLTCNLQLDKFSITLNEEQYRQMVFCFKELERVNVSWKYRRWRPSVGISGNTSLWWQFASHAHVHHLTKKRSQATWAFALQRAKDVKRYVDVYYCHLAKPECLTTEMQKEKNALEQQLEFETLLSLRELVIQKVRREQSSWPSESRGQGVLQYWFPGWTGWYAKQDEASQPPSAEVTEDEASDIDDASSISTSLTTQIEEEILDALDSVDRDTFLMRDTVFARVCFSLSQCGLTLVGRHRVAPNLGAGDEVMQPLVELRFAEVTVDVESRPRLGSFLFAARLGSLHLQDRTAPNSAYPYMLSPHAVEQVHVFPKALPLEGTKTQPSIFKFLPFTSPSSAPFGISLMHSQKTDFPSVPLFELTYEKKPLGSSADHSLTVNTQSLDVVYNPSTIRTVKQFFTLFNYEGSCFPSSGGSLNLSAAARTRYEMFKKHTKEELRHHWDLMLEGEQSTLQIAKWDIHMDISAPQIIVPESFTDHTSATVLIDLGRVQFSNSSAPMEASRANVEDISDDEADFKTPCSSPPEQEELETVVSSPVKETAMSDADIYSHMYKKYTLNLQDMQVLIGSGKDSWKFAQTKGTSRMHVLDRFSIAIQVERRLLATDDPHWPSVVLNMKLPRLTAHVNEQKVHAMQMCLSRLKESTSTRPGGWSSQSPSSPCASSVDLDKMLQQEGMSESAFANRSKEPHDTSLLLVAQCSIEQMCLEVQSRGRCIAELQVTGIQATFSKTPQDLSVTMSVHGLLLVDALQTYGPDFELLVASHKHVSMDSRSGSIRDSDPNSPTSPATPPLFSIHPTAPPMQTIAVPKVLSAILSTLQSSPPKVLMDRQRISPIGMLDAHEADALINVEISILNVPSSGTNDAAEQLFIAAVQFNNLDVIANQETIVELVNFARCLTPYDSLKVPAKTVSTVGRISMSSQVDLSPSYVQATPSQISSLQLTFDFHRFNVLLLRAVSKKGSVSGQKVATATVSGARIQASIGSSLEIQGTLGGLQVCDLISEKTLHRRIVSMGSDPHLGQDLHDLLGKRHHTELYRSLPPASDSANAEKAFEFTIKRYGAQSKQTESECLEVVARMASVCYTHSPLLLHELASCAVEFKHCVSMLAQSIKNAATEVALGIVNLPAQSMAFSFHVCPPDSVMPPTLQREISLNEPSDVQAALPLDVKLDILLQTPVIVLPCSPSSRDVLVAHLGRISLQNTNSSMLQSAQFEFNSCDPHKAGLFFVQFRDMNLYSLNIDENLAAASGKIGATGNLPPADSLPVVDLYSCRAHGRPILHDTIIEFTVQYKQPLEELEVGWFNDGSTWLGDQGNQGSTSAQLKTQPTLEVSGTVINVLKFAVTKYQYELLLQSTKNITYCKDIGAEEEDMAESLHISSSWDELAAKESHYEHERPQQSLVNVVEDGSKHMAFNYHVNFMLPELVINICSDLCNDKQDLVALSFQEFVVNYEQDNPYETLVQLSLKGVIMEDLVESPESSHRYLIRSTNPENEAGDSKDVRPPKSDFISFSCPDMTYHIPTIPAHPSLPDRLCTQNVFQAHLKKNKPTEHAKKRGQCASMCASPSTPPPSPCGSTTPPLLLAQEDSLMHINMHLIDRCCPDFTSKHNSVSKAVTVDVNSLEVVINSQTWVMVLDFLGLAADLPEEARPTSRQDSLFREDLEVEHEPQADVDNTELEVNIRNFIVTLNKPTYELARATISGFSSHLSLRDSNITLQASLGKICVLDLTGHGQLYRERFITAGPEALHFTVFKYGSLDPDLQRDCDIKVKCEMSSVHVVHTQRFLTEVTDFFADFSDLQMLLKAATAGNKMNLEACRAPRVQLEVTAASPVIVVPQSYRSFDVLVANLGNLNITTTFRFTGEGKSASSSQRASLETSQLEPARKGCTVISAEEVMKVLDDLDGEKCLLQVMDVELVDMDVYSGVCVPACQAVPVNHPEGSYTVQFPSIFIKKNGGPLLKRTLMLHLLVEKNLDSAFNHSVPDWTVEGNFSSVHVTLDRSQYALVHGILSRNLGETVERTSASNLTLVELFPEQQGGHNGNSWTFLAIRMALVNVTLELVHAHARLHCANAESTLAKVELIRSKLTLERFSDQSNDIDLVSHEIRILDTRFKDAPVNNRPNVFTNILLPTKNASKEKVLQAEIHYRITHNTARFTVLLNNMRVMAIFSWISELAEFLSLHDEHQVLSGAKQPTSADLHISQNQSSVRRMTKQWQQQQQPIPEVPLELKLNMTDTEIVVVEDSAAWDTNAVILKSTAVLSYHKALTERPLSCNLQNLEVFSCILGLEDDTALSIIDPISVYIDLVDRDSTPPDTKFGHVLQVGTMNLNLRLSYNDVKMFLRILDSIPKEWLLGGSKMDSVNIDSLLEMGFSREDCLRSLEACSGNLNDAALWLTQNAATSTCLSTAMSTSQTVVAKQDIVVSAVELKVSYFCLCIIDDCMDADVPLLEIDLRETYISQELSKTFGGESKFFFSIGYYNRALSGWEPIIEPWRCNCQWEAAFRKTGLAKCHFKINAEDVLKVNITTALLDLYQKVKTSWATDFYQLFSAEKNTEKNGAVGQGETPVRRRSPFVPFAIKNDLGVAFRFTAFVSATFSGNKDEASTTRFDWKDVEPGQVVPFTFEGRGKIRHQDSHELRMHRLVLKIPGYTQLDPVSVEKVGVYFKYARPLERQHRASGTTRVLFNVTLDGNARKMITVQSALVIKNRVEVAVDLKLETAGVRPYQICLQPKCTSAVPLPYVFADMWVRPTISLIAYSALEWQHVATKQQGSSYSITCCPIRNDAAVFRFSVDVKREKYPDWNTVSSSVPGHTISLLPPIRIHNLLPCELEYVVNEGQCRGIISAQKNRALHEVNTEQYVIIGFSLENFRQCTSLVIPPGSSSFSTRLETHDTEGRLLVLHARVSVLRARSLKVYVSVPYWIINRSGLPLIFKQEGTNSEAAGQFPEHEQARSMVPLLFSFADTEASMMCSMRVGMELHPRTFPQWCMCFSLEKGIKVRRLMVSPNDARPDWVYTIGVEIRQGRGNYMCTNYVVLSPRFLIDNQSSSVVQIAQRFATKELHQHRHHISLAKPKSNLPFHWPRVDLDNLLCVRLVDTPGCMWSGGFKIDELNSFHIHMRDDLGRSHFLRVEVILKGATFFIIFMDCAKIPPPLRIDNQSEVPVTFHQTHVSNELLRATVKAHTSVPYAWDEPTLPPHITVTAPGGMSEAYDMTIFRAGKKLYYENFFYIAFSGTFLEPRTMVKVQPGSKDVKCQELVLDVPQGTRVVINKKELGKRSQLWRMTSTGMLQHEGSSTPREPRPSAEPGRMLVLDIAGLGPEPKKYTELMLRKPDGRRRLTQTWQFCSDGRLCCQLPGMFVQPRDGFHGLRRGNDVVLGPPQPVSFECMPNGVPLEQAVTNQKMRGGSGVLLVRVIPKGPTIVLCVSDFMQKQKVSVNAPSPDASLLAQKASGSEDQQAPQLEGKFGLDLELNLHLLGGLGVSVINHLSEELIYAVLQNIRVNFIQSASSQLLDASVENVQVDNQLHGAERPVALYVTPLHERDRLRHLPAIVITAERLPQKDTDVVIFQHFIMHIKNITLALEELLMLKIVQFLHHLVDDFGDEVFIDNQLQRAHAAASANARRFYFNTLKLRLDQVKLSVLTLSHRPPELDAIKKRVGWSLMRFEDVAVELDSFVKSHPFESLEFLVNNVVEHYRGEFQSHAAKILGAVDFLGDPVGLFNDVCTGWSDFMKDGNAACLLKGVTHGLSNSTAKMAGSLSESLTTVANPGRQLEQRSRSTAAPEQSSERHIVTGLRRLGSGVVGGFTSIAKHSYQGAINEGVQGLLTGLGKGLIGTVAMPAAGLLDLVTEAASIVRDTSKPLSHVHPRRCRAPRLCSGPGGLLPCYSTTQALGQQFLCNLTDASGDLFVAMEQLESRPDGLRVLISTERAFIIKREGAHAESIVHVVHYSSLSYCRWFPSNLGPQPQPPFYVEFLLRPENQRLSASLDLNHGSLRVGCESETTARKVVQLINYARDTHEERKYTAHFSDSDEDD